MKRAPVSTLHLKRHAVGPRDLVYGVFCESLVIMPRSVAEDLARTCRALSSAKTWGEFRARVTPKAFARLWEWVKDYDEMADGPADDAPFEGYDIGLVCDGDYPDWPQQKMLEWLPDEIQREFGEEKCSVHNGLFLTIDPEHEVRVVRALRRLGYRCRRRSRLVHTACGGGQPAGKD